MDLAYDHIQEEALSPDKSEAAKAKQPDQSLNSEFQEAYKAISLSPWGAKLGGFFGSVVKQGESVYKEAQQELTSLGEDALKGATELRTSLITRTRGIQTSSSESSTEKSESSTTTEKEKGENATETSEGMLERLRIEAARRLKEIQAAEDAADEALLKFGTNIRNFLRDAVTIAPPSDSSSSQPSTVMFESKDAHGKRVFHTTRFDAQLHVIHSSLDSFLRDPTGEEYESWSKEFDADKKTEDISRDLEKYEELRSAMEKLVPDRVAYKDFWRRYYFLRHSIDTAEARRRDILKGAAGDNEEEEVGWDVSDDSDNEEAAKPEASKSKKENSSDRPSSVASSTTIQPTSATQPAASSASSSAYLKPSEPRRSHDEKSQADSDGSYDVVGTASGLQSRAPDSPKESRKGDDSEEEDWE